MLAKILIALSLIAISFVLYLGTLEIKDINNEIKSIKKRIDTAEKNITSLFEETGDLRDTGLTTSGAHEQEAEQIMNEMTLIHNDVSRLKIEVRKLTDKSVFEKGE